MSTMTYRSVLKFNYDTYSKDDSGNEVKTTEVKYLPLDIVTTRTVNSSSNIITQPMLNGDTVADHSYRNPTTVAINGKFGIYGLYSEDESYDFLSNSSNDSRLKKIETVFEYLKTNGILCDLIVMPMEIDKTSGSSSEGSEDRFLARRNLAVESFNFNDNFSSMDYTLSMKEVIVVDDTAYETYEGSDDPSLAIIKTSSMNTYMLSLTNDQLMEIIVEALYNADYIEKSWIEKCCDDVGTYYKTLGKAVASISGILLVVGVKLATLAGKTALLGVITGAGGGGVAAIGSTLAAAAGPIAIAVVVIAIVIAAIYTIFKRVKAEKKKKKAKGYIALKNDSIEDGLERINRLTADVRKGLTTITTSMQIGSFQTNEPQSILLKVNGVYFTITVSRNTSANVSAGECPFNFEVNKANATDAYWGNYGTERGTPVIVDSYDNCTDSNYWFTDTNTYDYKVWIVNTSYKSYIDDINDKIANIDPMFLLQIANEISTDNPPKTLYYHSSFANRVYTQPYYDKHPIYKNNKSKFEKYESYRKDYNDILYSSGGSDNPLLDLTKYQLIICNGSVEDEYDKIQETIRESLGL